MASRKEWKLGPMQISWTAVQNKFGPDEKLFFDLSQVQRLAAKSADLQRIFREPPRSASRTRWLQWAESRRCFLKLASDAVNSDRFALSQSVKVSVAARIRASGRKAKTISLGVDVEEVVRVIRPQMHRRFTTLSELELGGSPLQVWTIKEAAFKANPKNFGTHLADYRLIRFTGKRQGLVSCGARRFGFKIEEWRGHYVTIAWVL